MNSALLAVDIGNTAIKAGWFEGSRPTRGVLPEPRRTSESPKQDGAPPLPEQWPLATAPWFVTSVNRPALDTLAEWRASRGWRSTFRQIDFRDIPLRLDVDFPERVGLDRLATAVAADWLREPRRSALVVDAGTALKVHVVTADGTFAGGAILPGFRLASEALHAKTDLLPRIPVSTNDAPPPVIGRNTEAAIRSGIYWGAVGAVRELIARLRAELPTDPHIFITGGDAAGLSALIDHDTRFVPHLCLAGIALIVHHHGWLDAAAA